MSDPRQLARYMRICKRFQALLTRMDDLWKDGLTWIQSEYFGVISEGILKKRTKIRQTN